MLCNRLSNYIHLQVVSGALDRLHYEKDPCVKFDSARKNWIYLHGDRTAEELGRCWTLSGLFVQIIYYKQYLDTSVI